MGTVTTDSLNMKLLLALGFFGLLALAQRLTGTAAPTTCTVPPLLLTVHLLLPRRSLLSWLPRSNAMELCAQLDVAQNRTGTAALTTCTVLPLLLTVLLLPPKQNW